MNGQTYHLHLQGRVQGVGFRPHVYRLAQQYHLVGWVSNTRNGVHVVFNATPELCAAFAAAIVATAPPQAQVEQVAWLPVAPQEFDHFAIVQEEGEGVALHLALAPDFALCADCIQELKDPTNRRYGYPFTTCTQCGPRFALVTQLPYDRERTTMVQFQPCAACAAEYHDPQDRRFFAQTLSCSDCGIAVTLHENQATTTGAMALSLVQTRLAQGEIVAVKGQGGYLFLVDARNSQALQTLRQRKHRPRKPFALLYPTLELLARDVVLSPAASTWLTGPVAPIVLLPLQAAPQSNLAWELIAPGLDQIGAFLPYNALLWRLAHDFGYPLVATSGNLSGEPILFADPPPLAELNQVATAVLTHDLPLALPQDDSVLRLVADQPVVLRRSRGFAPAAPTGYSWLDSGANRLALGAHLKSTFAWLQQGRLYLSPYLGALEDWRTQAHFRHTLAHFGQLLANLPQLLLTDAHPQYFVNALAQELGQSWRVPVYTIGHHLAHFAAVLAENQALNTVGSQLGLIWDGAGWGDARAIWGGEVLLWQEGRVERVAHLAYFPQFLGDKMSREPRLAALSLLQQFALPSGALEKYFTPLEWRNYLQLLHHQPSPWATSSMGRLFDGIAALLGLCHINTYEGEAALALETLATRQWQRQGWPDHIYPWHWENTEIFSPAALLSGVLHDQHQGVAPARIALRFHAALVELVEQIAARWDCRRLFFSGGVWQNALLVTLVRERLGASHDLFFHQQLSPNDENIAFGQLVAHQLGWSEPLVTKPVSLLALAPS